MWNTYAMFYVLFLMKLPAIVALFKYYNSIEGTIRYEGMSTFTYNYEYKYSYS